MIRKIEIFVGYTDGHGVCAKTDLGDQFCDEYLPDHNPQWIMKWLVEFHADLLEPIE